MSLSGILFDKDGTLLDFNGTWGPTVAATIAHFSQGDASLAARIAALNHFDPLTRTFAPTSPFIAGSSDHYGPMWAQMLGRADALALKRELDSKLAEEGMKNLAPIGAPAAVLAALHARGARIGVATNDSERGARRQVTALGLDPYVDFVVGYDSGHGAKPLPGMVHAFARFTGLPEKSIALVGDSTHDLNSARSAGAVGIAVLSGIAGRDELAPLADHVLGDISALPALFDALRAAASRA